MATRRRAGRRPDPNEEAFGQAEKRAYAHPMFRPLLADGYPRARFRWTDDEALANGQG